jgi:hypothetical protein
MSGAKRAAAISSRQAAFSINAVKPCNLRVVVEFAGLDDRNAQQFPHNLETP